MLDPALVDILLAYQDEFLTLREFSLVSAQELPRGVAFVTQ